MPILIEASFRPSATHDKNPGVPEWRTDVTGERPGPGLGPNRPVPVGPRTPVSLELTRRQRWVHRGGQTARAVARAGDIEAPLHRSPLAAFLIPLALRSASSRSYPSHATRHEVAERDPAVRCKETVRYVPLATRRPVTAPRFVIGSRGGVEATPLSARDGHCIDECSCMTTSLATGHRPGSASPRLSDSGSVLPRAAE